MVTTRTRQEGSAARSAGGGRDAVQARHLDVEQGHVGAGPPGLGDDLVAPADLGDHLEVGLEVEQRGQRAPDQRLVVGEQQPDRRRCDARHTRTVRAKPPSGERPHRQRPAGRLGPFPQPDQAMTDADGGRTGSPGAASRRR